MRASSRAIIPRAVVEEPHRQALLSPFAASVLLSLLVVWECAILVFTASRKRLWYDELLTMHISGLQPFSGVWDALKAGVDAMPPGFYLMIRLARAMPLDMHIAMRLFSVSGYLLTLAGVFWFVRTRLSSHAGLLAALVVALSPFRAYAIDARPYCWLVGCLAIAAVCWQNVGKTRLMTALFAVWLSLAVASHYLAILAICPFALAELALAVRFRRIRWGVWSSCFIAALPFVLALPLILHFRAVFGRSFWSQPSWTGVVQTYGDYLGLEVKPILVLLAFFAIVVCASLISGWRNPELAALGQGFTLPEIILVAAFVFYPACLVVLTKIAGSGYTSRYGWPAIFGLSVGCVYLLRSVQPAFRWLLPALLLAFVWQIGSDFKNMPAAGSTVADSRWIQLQALCASDPDIPVVIASPLTYLEAVQYSPAPLHGRLTGVVDPEQALRLTGTDNVDEDNRRLMRFVRLNVRSRASFEAAYPRFFLYSGGAYDWLTPYLTRENYTLTLLSADKTNPVYLVER